MNLKRLHANYQNTLVPIFITLGIILVLLTATFPGILFFRNFTKMGATNFSTNPDKKDTAVSAVSVNDNDLKGQKDYIERVVARMQDVVDASVVLLSRSQNDNLKKVAQSIIEDDSASISELKIIYKQVYGLDFPDTVGNFDSQVTTFGSSSATPLDIMYTTQVLSQNDNLINDLRTHSSASQLNTWQDSTLKKLQDQNISLSNLKSS